MVMLKRPYWLSGFRGSMCYLLPEELDAVKAVFGELTAGQFPNQYKNYWLTREGERRLIAWSNTAILAGDAEMQDAIERSHRREVAYVIGTGLEVT